MNLVGLGKGAEAGRTRACSLMWVECEALLSQRGVGWRGGTPWGMSWGVDVTAAATRSNPGRGGQRVRDLGKSIAAAIMQDLKCHYLNAAGPIVAAGKPSRRPMINLWKLITSRLVRRVRPSNVWLGGAFPFHEVFPASSPAPLLAFSFLRLRPVPNTLLVLTTLTIKANNG